jgi:hypothetical protein
MPERPVEINCSQPNIESVALAREFVLQPRHSWPRICCVELIEDQLKESFLAGG